MVFQLTLDIAMMHTYTQKQAHLSRAQKLLDAAHPLIGIRAEKARLDRLFALAERILRRTR